MLEEQGFSHRDRNWIERNLVAGCENALVWLWVLRPRVAPTLTAEATGRLDGMIEELAYDVNCGLGNLLTDGKETAEQIYTRVMADAKEKQEEGTA